MALPVNRGIAAQGIVGSTVLPEKVKADNFGERQAATTGLAQGRAPQPRPVVVTTSATQAKEKLSLTGEFSASSVERALSSLQQKIAASTAQARALPFANGKLFQGVTLASTLGAGTTSQRPPDDGLPDGFLFYDLTIAKPLWLFGGVWIDAAGASAGAASAGALATTNISHGFGTPASGVFVTNVQNAIVQCPPKLVLTGGVEDNTIARVWFSYLPAEQGTPTADFYIYQ